MVSENHSRLGSPLTAMPRRLHDAFRELGGPPQIYLAINTDDSSIVYYKISSGIVKPPV